MYGDTFNLILGYIFLGIFTLLVLKKSYIYYVDRTELFAVFFYFFFQTVFPISVICTRDTLCVIPKLFCFQY